MREREGEDNGEDVFHVCIGNFPTHMHTREREREMRDRLERKRGGQEKGERLERDGSVVEEEREREEEKERKKRWRE